MTLEFPSYRRDSCVVFRERVHLNAQFRCDTKVNEKRRHSKKIGTRSHRVQ